MFCDIVTQDRPLFSGEVDMVVAPGSEGVLGILPHHTPLLTTLSYGILIIKRSGREAAFAIAGGIMEVLPHRVTVLADIAERSDEIDIERAHAARERADEMLTEGPPPDPGSAAAFEAQLRKAEVRIKVARRARQRQPGSVSIRTPNEE